MARRLEAISIDFINTTSNTRKHMDADALQELASSIKGDGLVELPVVVEATSGYELVSGGRQLQALKGAGQKEALCAVLSGDAGGITLKQVMANRTHRPVSDMALARALGNLKKENPYVSDKDIGTMVGIKPAKTACLFGLLSLPERTQGLIESEKLGKSMARELLKLRKTDCKH